MSDDKKKNEKLPEEKPSTSNENNALNEPDPETLGPEPQEKMKGPVSSVIRKIAEEGDEEEKENDEPEEEGA
ncbi:hypothetical protein SAMN05660909_02603 [Chitinophaga terrae (ex Kim and Jung 2007)]|jgi:hypothetical protein|uniref:Uncharacterized protein n=1 Tax=Chitinophaga terrae (ex Kim and Jung 2007) TaxID=408074 RepID=A0A1H4CFC2_9BACT|nr:hypothetical protein [Chitinophaga terrae (ex Kim and Jung 2007)]MDQ0109441.1 hypothetical protein [Chitinophaga terrae (ex Kim and Jung 2007)]GEP88944.1 hypothetical protein CTE07_05890 [Chitinophaga terrae (ex Kim and Jung 2007)]SEA59048.1 hypothetical protein SAMN05660909_02603 [Chitinophaga terrae (ex Kim and Jung 2007)]